jgi:hypothetical protein
MSVLRSLPLALTFAAALCAQDAATLSGAVLDSRDTAVPGAQVSLTDIARGTVRQTPTDSGGLFAFDALPPGDYALEVAKPGFKTLTVAPFRLTGRDRRTLALELHAASADPATAAASEDTAGISFDPAAAAAVDQRYVEFLPLRARTIPSLFLLAPGIIPVGREAVLSANGLPPSANYFTIDGVSAPLGAPGEIGTLSFDAVQAVAIQSSAIAPEFGRTAGAQLALTTRSGINEFHGAFFVYHRHDRFAANDWFANNAGLPRGELRYNNFGGGAGGPLSRDRTYFFASYEGLRARLPQTAFAVVPAQVTRETAAADIRPYWEAFPLPNGPQFSPGAARFSDVVLNRSDSDSAALRLDHSMGRALSLFARYQYAPRSENRRETASPNVLTDREAKSQTLTAALTWMPGPQTTNDFRVNYSTWTTESLSRADNFGGASPIPESLLFPEGIRPPNGSFVLSVLGASGYAHGVSTKTRRRQVNIVDTLSHLGGSHYFRVGVDYRRLAPTYYYQPYGATVTFNSFTPLTGGLLSGTAAAAAIVSSEPAAYPLYSSFSLYAHDTWKATSRTTITWGFRWDITPAPDVRTGAPPIAFSNFAEFPGVSRIDSLYATRWRDIGPRFGLAYQLDTTPGHEMMFRIGAGGLYDVGYGFAVGAFDAAPFVNQRTFVAPVFPLAAQNRQPIALPAVRPYGLVSGAERDLRAPRAYLWNASLERMFGRSQSLVLTYAAAKARDLLRFETRRSYSETSDSGSTEYDLLHAVSNGPSLNYQSIQLQFRRRLSQSLQTQLSYTYSHAIDHGAFRLPPRGFALIWDDTRRDSDFDVRHNLSFSGSYAFPSPRTGILRHVFGDWWTDWLVTARSSLPFEAASLATVAASRAPVRRLYAIVRPNYSSAQSLWLDDAAAPGGRRLNPDAFTAPTAYAHGSLPRNAIRGFNLFQADVSLRRRFALTEKSRLDLFAQAFNVSNHANFTNPALEGAGFLTSPVFGLATPWNAPSMGAAPRTVQFALRLEF